MIIVLPITKEEKEYHSTVNNAGVVSKDVIFGKLFKKVLKTSLLFL